MADIEALIEQRGLHLPGAIKLPPGISLGFPWGRIAGDRALISGHGPLTPDGSIAGPLGKVGKDLSLQQAQEAARLTGLAILSSLKNAIGDLDRVAAWIRAFGMVNAAPSFHAFPLVVNGFSDLIVSQYGETRGAHARSAVGVAGLPFGIPVEIEAEVLIRP